MAIGHKFVGYLFLEGRGSRNCPLLMGPPGRMFNLWWTKHFDNVGQMTKMRCQTWKNGQQNVGNKMLGTQLEWIWPKVFILSSNASHHFAKISKQIFWICGVPSPRLLHRGHNCPARSFAAGKKIQFWVRRLSSIYMDGIPAACASRTLANARELVVSRRGLRARRIKLWGGGAKNYANLSSLSKILEVRENRCLLVLANFIFILIENLT